MKVSTLTQFDCDLKDKQHAELLQLVHKNGTKTIEELCAKGERLLGQDNNLSRKAWHQDVVERLEFEKDQWRSGYYLISDMLITKLYTMYFLVISMRGNRWSAITVRMGKILCLLHHTTLYSFLLALAVYNIYVYYTIQHCTHSS